MRPSRPRSFEENGIATVVGAILILALATVALVTIRVQFVPHWQADAEATHSLTVGRQLAILKADVDRVVAAGERTTLSSALAMGGDKGGVFRDRDPNDRLALGRSALHFRLDSPQVLLPDPEGAANPAASYTSFLATPQLAGVERVHRLGIRIDQVARSMTGSLEIQIREGPDTVGRATVTILDSAGSGYYVRIVTALVPPAPGPETTLVERRDYQADAMSPYWLNLLHPDLRFDQLLRGATAPYALRFEQADQLTASHSVDYQAFGAGLSASGDLVTNYVADHAGAVLSYVEDNAHFVDQEFSLEHGALVLEQDGGRVLRAPPAFALSRVNDLVLVNVALPTLQGSNADVQSRGTVTVRVQPLDRLEQTILAPQATFTVDTSFPELWADHWLTSLASTGLSAQGPQPGFAVTTTATQAKLELFGTTPDPAQLSTYDLQILFHQCAMTVTIEP